MSDFVESVDDMIGRHFARDARLELQKVLTDDAKDWAAAEEILYKLVRSSLAHARSQVEGRKTGTMTFDEAMHLVHTDHAMITRPHWDILTAVWLHIDGSPTYWTLDNCNGYKSGQGYPFDPDDEDRAATDWMLYQTPEENWVELDF